MTLNNSGIDAREMALCCCFPCLRLGGNDEETPVPNQTSSSNSGPFGTVSPMHVQREGMLELPERINIRVSDSKKNLPPLSALYIEDNFNILTDLGNGLPSPHGQDEDEYCYHCPICFLNYRGIYRSSCCNNYFCYSCLHEYVASKYGISPQDLQVLQYPFWVDIPCPHCGTEIFEPQYVEKNEGIRSYREKGYDVDLKSHTKSFTSSTTSSPSVYDSCSTITSIYSMENSEEIASFNTNTTTTMTMLNTKSENNKTKDDLLSPVRVGDTFEKLVKKMQKYEDYSSSENDANMISHSSSSTPARKCKSLHIETRQNKDNDNIQENEKEIDSTRENEGSTAL